MFVFYCLDQLLSIHLISPLVMSGRLSISDRSRITLWFNQGIISNQRISLIHCTNRIVRNILRLFRETNNIIEREGPGRTLLNK